MIKPNQDCPMAQLFEIIGKKWVIFIIRTINEWEHTFNGIREKLWGLNAKILTDRLTELEEKWFVSRDIVNEKPVKIRYNLTSLWQELWKELESLGTRAAKNFTSQCNK